MSTKPWAAATALQRGLKTQERARKLIPGMTQLLSKRPDMFSLGVWPGYYSRAKGSRVWDLDGNEFIDMSIAGIGANILGYADPDVDAAVIRAVTDGNSCSLNCPEEVDLAERLVGLHPWADMVRYARTGGEAMAVAVRIARAHTGRDVVAFCGYHGWHDWYLAANLSHDALGQHLIPGLDPAGVPQGLAGTALPFHYNRLDELTDIIASHKGRLAAIVMEPIRNIAPAPGFLEGVRHLATEAGAPLIFDEISSGFRLATGGAHLKLTEARPDLAVFSKALGNGYPIAAVLGVGAVMNSAQKTFISSTYWTERIGPVAALATIEKHQRLDVPGHLHAIGEAVRTGWAQAAERHGLGLDIGGLSPMSHFTFTRQEHPAMKAFFIQEMLAEGFLASSLFYAMYAHCLKDVSAYLAAADRTFAKLAEALGKGDLLSRLQGQPAGVGFKRLN
jgi:glutamate-1-semialdehyde 2,1-aminomutase